MLFQEGRANYFPYIEITQELQSKLDYESKFDRSPENIGALIAELCENLTFAQTATVCT